MIVALLLLAAAPPETTSAALEQRAFAAADAGRFCQALFLFLEANELAPSDDLVFNAALVAEAAADRARALQLFRTLPAADPEVQTRLAAVMTAIENEGPGRTCEDVPPAGEQPHTREPSPPSSAGTPPIASMLRVTSPAQARAQAGPWITGVSGLLSVAGVVAVFAGLDPFFHHEASAEGIRVARVAGDLETAKRLQQDIARDADAYLSYGAPLAVGGTITAIAGVLGIAVGAGVWAIE